MQATDERRRRREDEHQRSGKSEAEKSTNQSEAEMRRVERERADCQKYALYYLVIAQRLPRAARGERSPIGVRQLVPFRGASIVAHLCIRRARVTRPPQTHFGIAHATDEPNTEYSRNQVLLFADILKCHVFCSLSLSCRLLYRRPAGAYS